MSIDKYVRRKETRSVLGGDVHLFYLANSRERSPTLNGIHDGRLNRTGKVERIDCFVTLLVLLGG